jgi:eukaryotic-like serine/threonine-protein kinase
MTLTPGTRLGPYEVIGPIGAGGMGEVYRARDAKLNRFVAIKVLHGQFAADPDRLVRFEREAQAIAALSHPGILAIHDFGSANGVTYAVMELLEGSTLRQRLDSAPLPPRRAIDVAIQIVRALAAAHDKGIVHRDLKPENIFVTADGHVKILDFGLARLIPPPAEAAATTTDARTADGVVLGSVGYMSPEQVRGATADHRSDIFSFGAVLYEMLTGKPAFRRDGAVETMNAILKEDPPDLALSDVRLTPALGRTVRHCLEKEPAERFQSAPDLAFDLEALRSGSDPAATPIAGRQQRRLSITVAAALVAASVAAGLFAGRQLAGDAPVGPSKPPSFTRLTFDQGPIWSGRLAPDGNTIVYAAAWRGEPIRTFLSRTEHATSTRLNLPDAHLLAISSRGELAVSIDHAFVGWMGEGTLARVPLLGGAPRPIVENVREADWTPDGSSLAIVRHVGGRERLEFPIGTVLYETSGYIADIRFSADGQRIAFADHPVFADNNGDVAIVDRSGRKITLDSGLIGLRGLIWSPDGSEVWFTASNSPGAGASLRAATPDGRKRVVHSLPTAWKILDVARDGRLLFAGETSPRNIDFYAAGETQPRDFSLFEQGTGNAISPDGRSVLITDQGNLTTWLRRVDRPEPVRLGEGEALDFSPDMGSVLSVVYGPPSRLSILPIGPGDAKTLPNPEGLTISAGSWLPDGEHVAFLGSLRNEALRGYVQNVTDGKMRAFTEPGVTAGRFWELPVSPDGSRVAIVGRDGRAAIYPIAGGTPVDIPTLVPGEFPLSWTADGRALFVAGPSNVPHRVFTIDLSTGRRSPWKELRPSQVAGIRLSQVSVTPDGRSFVHMYSRLLSNLYVAEGMR